MAQNKIIRVSEKFNKEIEDIQKKRVENGVDKKEISKPGISDLIITHNSWNEMKQNIIKFNFELEKLIENE